MPTLISRGIKGHDEGGWAMRECFIPLRLGPTDSSGGLAGCVHVPQGTKPAQMYRRLDRYFLPDALIMETKFIFNIKRRFSPSRGIKLSSETFRVRRAREVNKLIPQVFQTDRFCFPISPHVFIKRGLFFEFAALLLIIIRC